MLVIYCRVSTEEQGRTGYSLPDQRARCLAKAEEMAPGQPTQEFQDDYPGSILRRPALQAALDLCRTQPVSHFICMDPDRFSRDLKLQLIIADEIEAAKTELVFTDHQYARSAEGRMFFQLRGMVAEFEKTKIRERTMRGKASKLASGGIPIHINPFGYRLITRQEGGQTRLEVDEQEAQWVRLMFRWVADERLGVHRIARRLDELGVRAKKNGRWHPSSVANILRNTAYIGEQVLNRYATEGRYIARRDPGQTVAPLVVRPPEDWQTIAVPPIIERDTFQTVQGILAANRRQSQHSTHLLSGLATCGLCGRPMNYFRKRGRAMIRCSAKVHTYFRHAVCTGSKQLPAVPVEESVWQTVLHWLTDEHALTAFLESRKDSMESGILQAVQAELVQIEQAIAKRQAGQRGLLAMVASGDVAQEDATLPLSEGREVVSQLQDRRKMLQERATSYQQKAMAHTTLLAQLRSLRGSVANFAESPPDQQRHVLRGLLRSVRIYPNGEWESDLGG